ncbi:dienelactone hydrolase family protein [Klebsiella quasipneumoniae]|nr:dienelactone hydrolase family protein [Klebsiella quasipneumoniae]
MSDSSVHVINGNALILLHEIYGINDHIQSVRDKWQRLGFDVYTPALFPHSIPFEYVQQDEAYRHFSENVGFNPTSVVSLLSELREKYTTLLVMGYSVGATLAWLSAKSNLCDGVICHYGSRIRQYIDSAPLCPALIIIARDEQAFDTTMMRHELQKFPSVQCVMFDAYHGFCNPDSPTYDGELERQVYEIVSVFTNAVLSEKLMSLAKNSVNYIN